MEIVLSSVACVFPMYINMTTHSRGSTNHVLRYYAELKKKDTIES